MAKDCSSSIIRLYKFEGMFSCGFCSTGFMDKLDLLEHIQNLHAVEVQFRGFPILRLQKQIDLIKKAKVDRIAIRTTNKALGRRRKRMADDGCEDLLSKGTT